MAQHAKEDDEQQVQLDVDLIILDYLLYKHNQVVLKERRSLLQFQQPVAPDVSEGDRLVNMVDGKSALLENRYLDMRRS